MSIFSKLFGLKKETNLRGSTSVTVEKSWHYAGQGECPVPQTMAPVELPSFNCADAVGYFNLAVYDVCGHTFNSETKRDNKKSVRVNALNVSDAEIAAMELGVLGPYTVTLLKHDDMPPNEYQLGNAKEYGIAIPSGAVDADVRAMVYRKKNRAPTSDFATYCTMKRIRFSRFICEDDLVRLACDNFNTLDRVSLFAYAVHCAIRGIRLESPLSSPIYSNFANTASEAIIKLILERGADDLPIPRKGTKAWNIVAEYVAMQE